MRKFDLFLAAGLLGGWLAGTMTEDNPGMWVLELAAEVATQKTPGDQGIGIPKGVAHINLLSEGSGSAISTGELPVEGIQLACLGVEKVFMAFDRLPGQFGVEFFEDHCSPSRL